MSQFTLIHAYPNVSNVVCTRARREAPAADSHGRHYGKWGCEFCKGTAHDDQLLLCDSCDRGYHTYCLSPPLEAVSRFRSICLSPTE